MGTEFIQPTAAPDTLAGAVDDCAAGPQRIGGFDLARSMALGGMLLVNFKSAVDFVVAEPYWLSEWIDKIEGRAAATFLVLAGAGVALRLRKVLAGGNAEAVARQRSSLLKRAVVLFLMGIGFMTLWPADILHHYALFTCIGLALVGRSDRMLCGIAALVLAGTPLLGYFFNDPPVLELNTRACTDASVFSLFLFNLLMNGYYPLFPWLCFVIAGIWVGRQDVRSATGRYRILATGVLLYAGADFVHGLPEYFESLTTLDIAGGTFASEYLFLLDPWEPCPLFAISACGTAFITLWAALVVERRYHRRWWMAPFLASGRVTLTIYLLHVAVGMELLEHWGLLEGRSVGFAAFNAGVFYLLALTLAPFWIRRFTYGPLEWLIRRF